MTEHEKRVTLVDIPDPAKIEEHGISIDAPTPTQFVMDDPWVPSNNGSAPAGTQPQASGSTEIQGSGGTEQ